MANCVIRKLKESINDENLYALNTLIFNVSSASSPVEFGLYPYEGKILDLEVTDTLYFTNSGGNNLGTTLTVSNSSSITLPANTSGKLIIKNAQNLSYITSTNNNNITGNNRIHINIYDLLQFNIKCLNAYRNDACTGDIKYLENSKNLNYINLYNCQGTYGDISVFRDCNAFTNFSLFNETKSFLNDQYYGNIEGIKFYNTATFLINGTEVTGNIACLDNYTFSLFAINCPKITGDCANIHCSGSINISATNIYGDISQIDTSSNTAKNSVITISACTNLTSGVNISNMQIKRLTQQVSVSTYYVDRAAMPTFSWPSTISRPYSYYIIALENVNLGNSIDNMLINQANCQLFESSNYTTHTDKQIAVFGTRTSASDAAVTTLKSKGFRIIVNGADL